MANENNLAATKICKEKILSAPIESIGKSFLEDLFASYHDKKTNEFREAPFDPTWKFTLTNAEYKWVDGSVDTTLGLLFFNRFILERTNIIQHLHYWNKPINAKNLKNLNNLINNLVLTDQIDTKTLGSGYIDSRDQLGFWCASFLSVAITAGLIKPMENVNKRKKELFEKYKDELQKANAVEQTMICNAIEKELMGIVRENLKDDPGYDLYASGDGNLDNNYKTINVMRGAVYNNITKRYDVVQSSLMDGIKKQDIPAFSNSVLAAAYPSAVGTAQAGEMSKIILALLQSEQIDPDRNSDCGTTSTIPITITDFNKQYMLFRNINVNGKIVTINLNNVSQFVGKTVRMYSYQCCLNNHICAKCAGPQFHNLGVTKNGLLSSQITQKVLNLKLKAKHDLSQSAGIIPEGYVFLNQNQLCTMDRGVLKNKATMRMFIPRILEDMKGFVREATIIDCMGVFPVKFYDKHDNEILSTMMIVPAMLTFNIYSEIQEDVDNYIISYEPNSEVCEMKIQKTVNNVEFFINQIYLHSSKPQLPYDLMTELMFRCLEINNIDLTGPISVYEMLARRVCRHDGDTFAKVYGRNMKCDTMSYDKESYRVAVQRAGVLQGILFQDISKSATIGLAASLNGIEPVDSPLEKIIKA